MDDAPAYDETALRLKAREYMTHTFGEMPREGLKQIASWLDENRRVQMFVSFLCGSPCSSFCHPAEPRGARPLIFDPEHYPEDADPAP